MISQKDVYGMRFTRQSKMPLALHWQRECRHSSVPRSQRTLNAASNSFQIDLTRAQGLLRASSQSLYQSWYSGDKTSEVGGCSSYQLDHSGVNCGGGRSDRGASFLSRSNNLSRALANSCRYFFCSALGILLN